MILEHLSKKAFDDDCSTNIVTHGVGIETPLLIDHIDTVHHVITEVTSNPLPNHA